MARKYSKKRRTRTRRTRRRTSRRFGIELPNAAKLAIMKGVMECYKKCSDYKSEPDIYDECKLACAEKYGYNVDWQD